MFSFVYVHSCCPGFKLKPHIKLYKCIHVVTSTYHRCGILTIDTLNRNICNEAMQPPDTKRFVEIQYSIFTSDLKVDIFEIYFYF